MSTKSQFGLVSAIAWLLWKQTVRCVLNIKGSEGSTHVKGRDWKQDWADEEAELQCRPNRMSANLVESSRANAAHQNIPHGAKWAPPLLSFVVRAGLMVMNSLKFV